MTETPICSVTDRSLFQWKVGKMGEVGAPLGGFSPQYLLPASFLVQPDKKGLLSFSCTTHFNISENYGVQVRSSNKYVKSQRHYVQDRSPTKNVPINVCSKTYGFAGKWNFVPYN